METVTRKGTRLTVHLAAIHRVPAGHPEPIVEFRYPGGILCSSYYLSTFLEIPAGHGLCLVGGTYCQELPPDQVQACQHQCQAWMQDVQGIPYLCPRCGRNYSDLTPEEFAETHKFCPSDDCLGREVLA